MGVEVAEDQIDVGLVPEDDVAEGLQREEGEIDGLAAAGFDSYNFV